MIDSAQRGTGAPGSYEYASASATDFFRIQQHPRFSLQKTVRDLDQNQIWITPAARAQHVVEQLHKFHGGGAASRRVSIIAEIRRESRACGTYLRQISRRGGSREFARGDA